MILPTGSPSPGHAPVRRYPRARPCCEIAIGKQAATKSPSFGSPETTRYTPMGAALSVFEISTPNASPIAIRKTAAMTIPPMHRPISRRFELPGFEPPGERSGGVFCRTVQLAHHDRLHEEKAVSSLGKMPKMPYPTAVPLSCTTNDRPFPAPTPPSNPFFRAPPKRRRNSRKSSLQFLRRRFACAAIQFPGSARRPFERRLDLLAEPPHRRRDRLAQIEAGGFGAAAQSFDLPLQRRRQLEGDRFVFLFPLVPSPGPSAPRLGFW